MAWIRILLAIPLSIQMAMAGPNVPLTKSLSPAQIQEKKQLLVRNMFDFVSRQSGLVNSVADGDHIFFSNFNSRDRADLRTVLKSIKKFPTLRRKGDTLIASLGSSRVEIQWPDPEKPTFLFNGTPWTYDAAQPLAPQFLKLNFKEKHAAWWSPEPEAEAIIPLLLWIASIAGAAIIGACLNGPVTDMITPAWCGLVGWFHAVTDSCTRYKNSQNAALYDKAPKFDAVSNQTASDLKNVLAKFTVETWTCPSNNDGKPREYHGRIRANKMVDGKPVLQDGKPVPEGPWIYVHGKLDAEGRPQDFLFTKGDSATSDPDSEDDAKNLVVHVAYDPTQEKPVSYRVPNPDYDKTGGFGNNSPTMPINVSMKLTAQQDQGIKDTNDKLQVLNTTTYGCVEKKVGDDIKAGVDVGSPAKPVLDPNASKATATQ